jgi:hypothetical protein
VIIRADGPERYDMSGTVGFENVKFGVKFVCSVIAGGIHLFKNRDKIVAEIKDTQVEEVIDLVVVDVRQGIGEILEAAKS